MSGEWIELAAPPLAATFVTALVLSWLATGAVLRQLRRRAILDRPNERSSHAIPTPRGGGLGTGMLGAAAGGAALGFLGWNWRPARVFMGEVGGVRLGYLLGWLLLNLAAAGYWAPALILPLYFLADASWTLLRRLARGEKIWQPHREHFYQHAVQAGRSHQAVVLRVLFADLVLIGASLWAAAGPEGAALAVAIVTVAILLVELSRPAKPS